MVPGFMADTYSCEAWYVELARSADEELGYLWLVPEIGHLLRDGRAWHPDSARLAEPLFVARLRAYEIPHVVGNVSRLNAVHNLLLFRRVFKEHRIDAVYTHFGHERFWAAFLGKLLGKTTIWTEHWHSLGTRYIAAKRIFYRLFIDNFVAVSAFIAGTLPRGSRVFTVPNALPIDRAAPSESEAAAAKAKLGIAPTSVVVLYVAAFTRQKRHEVALQVCQKVLRRRADVLFIFLGDGAEREAIARSIARSGHGANIRLPGHVKDVETYYLAADISMFTAHNDAAPLAVLESMKYSLPVVAFASGGPIEFIRDMETGALVPEGDIDGFAHRLLQLVDDESLRAECGRNARRLLEDEYGLDAWIGKMKRVLKSAVRCQQIAPALGLMEAIAFGGGWLLA